MRDKKHRHSNLNTTPPAAASVTGHGRRPGLFVRAAACLLTCILAASGLSGCRKTEKKVTSNNIKVDTAIADIGRLEISTDYIGTLSPNVTIDVIPLVAGTVEYLPVKVGDRVEAGDLLCQLDDTSADLSVQSARDAVATARAGKEAAEIQSDSAKIQADSNVKTLEKTLKGYKDSLKTAQKQLDKLKESRKNIQKASAAAEQAYLAAKKRYRDAETILIQFEDFLNKNPDCKTTPGLTAAATPVPEIPSVDPVPVPTDTSDAAGQDGQGNAGGEGDQDGSQTVGGDTAGSGSQTAGGDTTGSGSQTADGDAAGSGTSSAADQAKQRQAQALLEALTEAGLTVEYLGSTGIRTLNEDVDDVKSSYSGVGTGLSQLDANISTLKTSISQLKAQISTTEASLKSARKLAKAASAGSDAYDAQIEAAKTGVEAAEYQKDLYRVTSPIDGIVDAVNVKEKALAAQGLAAFTISEKDSMIVTFYVPEDVKNFLRIGDRVTLFREGDKEDPEVPGHITLIGTAVDPQKGLFKVEAEVITTGQKELSGGSSVKLSVVSNAVEGEIVIPYDCVYYDDGQAYVYLVTDGKAVRTDITTGLFNQNKITVTSGLNAGDCVITTWASGLKDGAKVEIISGEES